MVGMREKKTRQVPKKKGLGMEERQTHPWLVPL